MQTRRKETPTGQFLGVFLLSILVFTGSLGALAPAAQAGIADHLVINEIQTDSTSGTGGTETDWVELFNPTGGPIDLAGWSLQRVTSGGTIYTLALSGSVPAGGYFLVARNGAGSDPAILALADLLAANAFTLSDNNGLFLVQGTSAIDPSVPGANVIDAVGWGGIEYGETLAYPGNIPGAKSLSRVPDGEDSDNNAVDFLVLDTPTPRNSGHTGGNQDEGADNDLGGQVLLTITTPAEPVQNITPYGAEIHFAVNADAAVTVLYGPDEGTVLSAGPVEAFANIAGSISLSGLECSTRYYYRIIAAGNEGGEDQIDIGSFSSLSCGLNLDGLVMTKANAKADNSYHNGWAWTFDLTVWDESENSLRMKFDQWSGISILPAAGNMRFSVDNGISWVYIDADNEYSAAAADISGLDLSADPGRQIRILVEMKVPVGTKVGYYQGNYGILTE